jgi:cyclic beta-1,2-glucan synthetase
MTELGHLIGFFASPKDARLARRRLRRRGFGRVAVIQRSSEGRPRIRNVGPIQKALLGLAVGGALGALLGLFLSTPAAIAFDLYRLATVGISTAIGALVGIIGTRQIGLGVDPHLAEQLGRWMLNDETAVIVQGEPGVLSLALPILRQITEEQPAVFPFHPKHEYEADSQQSIQQEVLTGVQFQEHALLLAKEHRTVVLNGTGEPLLAHLDRSEKVIGQIRSDLDAASRLELGISPSAEWILDNAYVIQGHIDDVRLNLPRRFYHELPILDRPDQPRIDEKSIQALPRAYALASEMVLHTDGRLDRANITEFLEAYQSVEQLTIGELWAMPIMVRIALIDRIRSLATQTSLRLRQREESDFWAHRLVSTVRRDPNQLFSMLAALAEELPDPSPYFAVQFSGQLYDEEAALIPARSWLERRLESPLAELVPRQQAHQAANQVSMGNAVTSLRQLALLDWRDVFEQLSRVEGVLRGDPTGDYRLMDFETRDRYRHAVEEIARGAHASQEDVARAAVRLAAAQGREETADPRAAHVGTYLIGPGRRRLVRELDGREQPGYRVLHWAERHAALLYIGGVVAIALLMEAALLALELAWNDHSWPSLLIGLLALLPVSQLAVQIVNYLVTRIVPPRTLPKMSFQSIGIPDAFRTLIVVPLLLEDETSIREEVEKLEVRYLANPDGNLIFALFSDLPDAPQAHLEEDARRLQAAVEGIESLNARHGANRFYLFHREREWCESEGSYIGWERKRGKLDELNRLLCGEPPRRDQGIVRVGDPNQLQNIRYVITLDSDTQLPRDTARRLVETLAHPLNRPWLRSDGSVLAGGYTIIQPRVSTSLPSATASPFSRLFTDPIGSDPYTKAVSDVYQDLAGEGSYQGKGIYDPRAFYRTLSDRFPEQLLLSHDLIEGAHVRVGLASDIELFDEFPGDYQSYVVREHRWIRGDWQIADWIFPRVPSPHGRRVPNPLSTLDRWKILDNLRRSLVPPASVIFLGASWFLAAPLGAIASAVVGLTVLFQPLSRILTWLTSPRATQPPAWREIAHDVLRSIAEASFLPERSRLALDAILRVGYRRWISHRRLLEWTTAQMAQWQAVRRNRAIMLEMIQTSLVSILVFLGLLWLRPASLLPAGAFLVLWLASPLIALRLTAVPSSPSGRDLVSKTDLRLLSRLARKTWRYFDDFVKDESNWLPPDNYQVSHQNAIAPRTSPTNIGLWMLSVIGAHDFGFLTGDESIERLSKTFQTLERLESHQGHLLNWYDLVDLEPLEPRYVSTVDSGNLLASLWALGSGLDELSNEPLVGPGALQGLASTLDVLMNVIGPQRLSPAAHEAIGALSGLFEGQPADLPEVASRLRQAMEPAEALAEDLWVSEGRLDEPAYWAEKIRTQLTAWIEILDRYLPWVDTLIESSDEIITTLIGEDATLARRQALASAPSLHDLASDRIPLLKDLRLIAESGRDIPRPASEWLSRINDEFARSKWLAGEMQARLDALIENARHLSDGMNMRFLYDSDRRLFCIGYNVREARLDNSHYDLLASEARLAGFVAIARGDVRSSHWLAMHRPYRSLGRRHLLVSWSGTMFEYLMPLLVQRSFTNSLLERACREAIRAQIDYGSSRGVPWGISEAAYGDLDINRTYQYKAFGVPSLGLKRGLEEDLVVAPYATMLSLSLSPVASVKNLHRLSRLGLYDGGYGFYESIDFSRERGRLGGRGVIVRAYMAHHQAMSFLALDNFIHDQVMQRRFHADRRVKATEPLLYERIPVAPAMIRVPIEGRPEAGVTGQEVAPSVSRFVTPDTPTPKTLILSNGRYHLMVTNSGAGYSRWNDIDITRWRSDTTLDRDGTFCYLRDLDTDHFWSTTYRPTLRPPESYTVSLAIDRAEIGMSTDGIDSDTEITVSPEDDVEIRRVTLVNRSNRRRHLEVTSYVELALAPHAADRQHPAFNKLFVQTEYFPRECALVATRRLRDPDEAPVYVGHLLTFDGGCEGTLQFETDRAKFVGRSRTNLDPAAMHDRLSNSEGYVLDPVLSLRRRVSLEPGKHVQFSLVIGVAETHQKILDLIGKFGDPHAISQAFDLAWANSQLELRLLRIQPDDARRFQHLASFLLYPSAMLRPPPGRLQQNRLGQSALWPYGISGDLPIAILSIGEAHDIGIARQLLQAHTYWRRHGLKADLLILNEESSSYGQPLNEELKHLIQGYSTFTPVDQPGGVYLRSVDQIKEEDLTLMLAAAHATLVAARGPLPQQLASAAEPPEMPGRLPTRRVVEEPSAALPFMELSYFNGLGGFTPDGREYAIYLAPHQNTPAPWVNVIANPSFGTIVSESGSGFTWYGNSQQNRLVDWSNDPMSDHPSEAIFIRDEVSGVFWTPTPLPIRELDAYRVRHGCGYSVFEHNSHAIEQELTTFVPMNETGGEPVRVQRLKIRNDSSRRRRLSVTFYAEWALGESRELSQMHVVTNWDAETGAILARNRYHPDYGGRVAFAAISPQARSYTADRTEFLGRNRAISTPAAMRRVGLSGRTGAGLDPCAALQTTVDLAPGQTTEVICLLGQAASVTEAQRMVSQYNENVDVEEALRRTAEWWDELPKTLSVETPELAVNLMVNRWLSYQALSCRIWGRSGFYQSGGAFGFRDQLQDVMAFTYTIPMLAREHILRAAARQFRQGDVQHWWHPQSGAGARSRCSDDMLWLPFAAAHYVRVTGDTAIFDQQAPFVDARPLEDTEQEAYLVAETTTDQVSLYEHCQLAIKRGLTSGPHALPLIGSGDWNDGLNRVGIEGKGESVWLAWFLIEVLMDFADASEQYGRPDDARQYRQQAAGLKDVIEAQGWDGSWYRRAYFDDGTPLGSFGQQEASITSMPQSWAWISGAAQPRRAETALESAWEELVSQDEGLALLLTPAFDKSSLEPGYIKGYPPGVRENGGQYTHAAVWLAIALSRKGDGGRAVKLLRMLNPIERTRSPEDAARYAVEPYVVAGDVYRLPGQVGRGGWTWYTGSAGWMYRAWVEEVLGLKIRGGRLRVEPVIPTDWRGFHMTYRHAESLYEIQVDNPEGVSKGVAWIELDGRKLEGTAIPLDSVPVKHRLRVRMGTARNTTATRAAPPSS